MDEASAPVPAHPHRGVRAQPGRLHLHGPERRQPRGVRRRRQPHRVRQDVPQDAKAAAGGAREATTAATTAAATTATTADATTVNDGW